MPATLNIAPDDPEAPALDRFQANLGLVDAWEEEHLKSSVGTSQEEITSGCDFDPWNSPPTYCNGGTVSDPDRIDYIFVEDRPEFQIQRLQRRVFWRELAPPDQFYADAAETVPNYLADHIGLEMEFTVRP